MTDRAAKTELRKFGLTVGTAFVVLGTISWWRGHALPPRVMWTVAAALIATGVVAPVALGPVQRAWMGFATVLGHVNTRVILTVVFYVVITPVGLLLRLFRDPLDRSLHDGRGSNWTKREPTPLDPNRYERQF